MLLITWPSYSIDSRHMSGHLFLALDCQVLCSLLGPQHQPLSPAQYLVFKPIADIVEYGGAALYRRFFLENTH